MNRVESLQGRELIRATHRIKSNAQRLDTGCLEWTAGIDVNRDGTAYGKTSLLIDGTRKVLRAHRLSYMAFIGPIPAGLEVDHLCFNKLCVEPSHLEAVTQAENLRRRRRTGRRRLAVQGDVCPTHRTEVAPYAGYKSQTYYRCRLCYNEYQKTYRTQRMAEAS